MKSMTKHLREEKGSLTVLALIMLVVLTLIGIFATRTATTDLQIASSELPYKDNFYIAEGGVQREVAELSRGNYPVANVQAPQLLATQASGGLPAPAHQVRGKPYNFSVNYLGFFPPTGGYSALHFTRYDYNISTASSNVPVVARYYRIGPKAE